MSPLRMATLWLVWSLCGCHRAAPLVVPGSPCVSDQDCRPLYLCSHPGETCQWPAPAPDRLDADAAKVGPDAGPADTAVAGDASMPQGPADLMPEVPDPDVLPPADAGGRPPESFANLALWLDPTSGVATTTDRLVSWRDRSRFAYLATPLHAGPQLVRNAYQGRPAVRFGVTDAETVALRIPDTASLRWGLTDFALLVVLRYHNVPAVPESASGYALVFSKLDPDTRPFAGVGLFMNDPWPWFGGTGDVRSGAVFQLMSRPEMMARSERDGYNDGLVHLVVASRRADLLQLRIDGAESSQRTPALVDVSAPMQDVVIGAHPNLAQQQLEGDLLELVALQGTVTDEDLATLARFLMDKYRLLPDRRDARDR
jgi:hypothetical protein